MKVEIIGNLETVVRELIKFRKAGFDVYCEFNGHTLYSRNVTLDSAYLEVTGYTYAGFQEMRRKQIEAWEEQERLEKEASKAKKQEWISRGHKLIPEELWSEWERCIDIRIEDIYNGKEIEHALVIMEAYENGKSIDEIYEIVQNQNHSGTSHGMLMSIIKYFYTNSEQFIEEYNKLYYKN